MFRGEADLVATSLSVTLERSEVVDFGPPLGLETHAIFVARDTDDGNAVSWLTFVHPLGASLWAALAVNAAVAAAAAAMLAGAAGPRSLPLAAAASYAAVWGSYFGWRQEEARKGEAWSSWPLKVLTLLLLLAGNLIFMAYRASLTSKLSVRREKMPFDTLEAFAKSHFR